MRFLLATLCLFAISQPTGAQTTQDQVRLHFEEEMRGPLRLCVMSLRTTNVPLDGNATDIGHQVEQLLTQSLAAYKPEFTVSEKEAQRLLSDGPDQKANVAAVKENFILMQRSPLPKPAIISAMLGLGQSPPRDLLPLAPRNPPPPHRRRHPPAPRARRIPRRPHAQSLSLPAASLIVDG